MAVDRLVLLEPPQRIPVETHGARHRAVAVDIEYPRRRSVGLTGAYQGVQPRRTQLHSLRVVLVAQELHADIRQRDVVLRVVGNLPDIARRTGVEDEHMSEIAANSPRGRFYSSPGSSHLGVIHAHRDAPCPAIATGGA